MEIELLKALENKKIVCFGAGAAGQTLAQALPVPIAYFVDNNPESWQRIVNQLPVYNPLVLQDEDLGMTRVLITSMYYREIADQLSGMGFREGVHFFDGLKLTADFKESQIPNRYLPDLEGRQPRYGYGKPSHQRLVEQIGREAQGYRETLERFCHLGGKLRNIPLLPSSPAYTGPYWENPWLPPLDAVSIYGFLGLRRPRNYVEVGSGNSTKFARQAINDFKLDTTLISIDPQPRSEIDDLCDCCIRKRLEEVDLKVFDQLEPGDILFVDNSHQAFMNSDVTVFFMEILPNLKPGVLVGMHDIFLPEDYPPQWAQRLYGEQYLLAVWLLAGEHKIRIELPNHFLCQEPEFRPLLKSLGAAAGVPDLARGGGAFWMS